MIKRVLLPVVALAILWLVSIWFIGWRTQQTIEQGLVHFNTRISTVLGSDLSRADAHVSIDNYTRGWLTSRVRYRVELTSRQGEVSHYFLDDVLEHGPLPWSRLRRGQFGPVLAHSVATLQTTPEMQAWLVSNGALDTPLRVTTDVGFGGKGRSRLQFAALSSPASEQPGVSFSGGELWLEVSDQFRASQLQGHFDRYQQTDDNTEEVITLAGIDIDAQTSQLADSNNGLDHHGQVRIASLAVSQGEDIPGLRLRGIQASLATSQRHALMDIGLQYQVDQVTLDSADIGQLVLGMTVNRLDREALTALQENWLAQAGAMEPSGFAGLSETSRETLAAQLKAVLRHQPEWRLDPLVWQNEAGQSHASAALLLQDAIDESTGPDDWLLQGIRQAELQINLNRPMVVALFESLAANDSGSAADGAQLGEELFDAYAKSLERLGMVTRTGDDVQLDLRVVPGQNHVLLNESEITLEQLFLLGAGLFLQF